jgi:epoxyqueuosine reductase QueG
MIAREIIENEIRAYAADRDRNSPLKNKWRAPLVGFADAAHPGFRSLKHIVHHGHELPGDVLAGARTVIAYFVPFSAGIVRGNGGDGLASPEWAQAYEETNAMFSGLNRHMISFLAERGYRAAVSREASVFDREEITSRWSQRHIACLAGLGTFGLNNMLITEAGCCGRFGSVVTDLDVPPDAPLETEYCLYRRNGTCGACVRRCPTGALTAGGFDRRVCYARCLENARVYTQFGSSYAAKAGEAPEDSGSEVCGKCLTGLPCSLKKP